MDARGVTDIAHRLGLGEPAGRPGRALADPGELTMRFPVREGGVRFADDYGVFAKGRIHKGVDVFGVAGLPLVAVADGFVERVADHPTAGYYVVLSHAGGWESRYLHLNDDSPGTDDGRGGPEHAFAPGIEEGAFVAAGRQLGWVGDSGNAEWTAPHTHFELLRDGRVVNPYPYLVQAWEVYLWKRTLDLRQEAPERAR